MEAQKGALWARQVDRQTLGAHYDFIVGDITRKPVNAQKAEHANSCTRLDTQAPGLSGFTDRCYKGMEGDGMRKSFLAMPDMQSAVSRTTSQVQGDLHATQDLCRKSPPAGLTSAVLRERREPGGAIKQQLKRQTLKEVNSKKVKAAIAGYTGSQDARSNVSSDIHKYSGVKPKPRPSTARELGTDRGVGELGQSPRLLQHRGGAVGVCPAGQFYVAPGGDVTGQRSKKSQDGLDPHMRSGMAFILTPNKGDPPAPTKVTAVVKGKGAFCDGFSQEAQRHTTEKNWHMFRYSEWRPRRAHSQPPASNSAGMATLEVTKSDRSAGDSLRASGKMRSISARRAEIESVINEAHVQRKCNTERRDRCKNEQTFADLIAYTARNAQQQKQSINTIRDKAGSHRSAGVAGQLVWAE